MDFFAVSCEDGVTVAEHFRAFQVELAIITNFEKIERGEFPPCFTLAMRQHVAEVHADAILTAAKTPGQPFTEDQIIAVEQLRKWRGNQQVETRRESPLIIQ